MPIATENTYTANDLSCSRMPIWILTAVLPGYVASNRWLWRLPRPSGYMTADVLQMHASDNCWHCYRLHYPRRPAQSVYHQCQAGTCRLVISCVYIAWQWRNFVPHPCQLVFAAILWVKLLGMFVTLLSLKYTFFGKLMIMWTFFLN